MGIKVNRMTEEELFDGYGATETETVLALRRQITALREAVTIMQSYADPRTMDRVQRRKVLQAMKESD